MNAEASIFSPKNLADALAFYARNPASLLFAGGTSIMADSLQAIPSLSGNLICLSHIPELKQVNRTERFVDLGATLTISQMIDLGERILPRSVIDTALGIAHPSIRNLATLGGNLANSRRRMDLFAILACMDAQVELKQGSGSRWLPVSRLFGDGASSGLAQSEILCRVRIPTESWDLSLCSKLGANGVPDEGSYTFVFMARIPRTGVADIRIAFSGHSYFRRRDLENGIIGKTLPFKRDFIDNVIQDYKMAMRENIFIPSVRRTQFLSMLEWAIGHLAV